MKLDRLASPPQRPSPVAAPTEGMHEAIRHVAAAEGGHDRERSLQQELATMEPEAIGDFHGGERLLQEAHELAGRIADLGSHADALLRPQVLGGQLPHLDDSA